MKTNYGIVQQIIASILLSSSFTVPVMGEEANPAISSNAFLKLASEAMAVRENRLLSEARFLEYTSQPGTVILDTRSKAKYDKLHVKGAIHLNFSDFNEDSLRKVIPSKATRVLIYCNNNFQVTTADDKPAKTKTISQEELKRLMTVKKRASSDDERLTADKANTGAAIPRHQGSLALNLPTYLTLHGYGYTNVHELQPLLDINKTKIALAGTLIDKKSPVRPEISPKDLKAAMEVKRAMSPEESAMFREITEEALRQVRSSSDKKIAPKTEPAAPQRQKLLQSQR